jgi:spore coat polysaccharide biosynthesis protein SpsF
MKVHAIIQARMGSTRLPGKVLMRLGGDTVLAQVVQRCRRSRRLDAVAVATTTLPEDKVIEEECRSLGVPVIRGSAPDVLDRYAQAMRELGSDVVVRITSDCPLIDPVVIDDMVGRYQALRAAGQPCDYVSNAIERTFPRGLDAEVVGATVLAEAAASATAAHEREHVTPYVYGHPERFALHAWTTPIPNASGHRWTLDTPEDFALLDKIFNALGDRAAGAGWQDVLALVEAHPQWADINRHVTQKSLTA